MNKTVLLIDINDTLDDSDHPDRRKLYQSNKLPHWVMPAREGIKDFAIFLNEFHDKLVPIFWTSVWMRWQRAVARKYLNFPVIWFNWEEFVNFDTATDRVMKSHWIWLPKSRFIQDVTQYVWTEVPNIIWFEDGLWPNDKAFVDKYDNISHVGIRWSWDPIERNYSRVPDTLAEKIEEIKSLII